MKIVHGDKEVVYERYDDLNQGDTFEWHPSARPTTEWESPVIGLCMKTSDADGNDAFVELEDGDIWTVDNGQAQVRRINTELRVVAE